MEPRFRQAAIAALLAVSCGANEPGAGAGGGDGSMGAAGGGAAMGTVGASGGPANRSGSRLKIRSIQSEDGAQLVTGFFDTRWQLPCVPGRTADNVVRCLPVAPVLTSTMAKLDQASLQSDCYSAKPSLTVAELEKAPSCGASGVPPLFILGTGSQSCEKSSTPQYWTSAQESQVLYFRDTSAPSYPCLAVTDRRLVTKVPDEDFARLTAVQE